MKQIILIIVLSINISHSQSLDHLIEIAINQNLHLKALEKEYLAALERAPQVSQLPQPELGVGGFPLPVQTRLGPQITRLSATQMLPWWGTLESKEILILKQAQAQYERIAAAALKVKYEVEQAYFMLYELGQSQIIMQRNIEVLERLEQVVLAKVESGRNSTADVLRIQLQIEELTQEVQILERQKRKPQIAINQLLNRDLAMVVVVTDSLQFVDIKLDREQIKQQITNDHPMLKRYALQAEAARQAIKVNELAGKPSFGIGVDYLFINERTDINFLDNGRDVLQLRASVSLPIYRKKYEAKSAEETIKIEALEYQKQNTLHQFLASMEQTFADYESAKLRMDLYEKQKTITQSAIRVLEASYSAGNSDFDELLKLEMEIIDYDLKILKAIVQSWRARSEMERYFVFDGNTD